MLERLIDHFPDDFTPHPQQEKILNNIEQAFNEGYRFVVVTAPTGSGKSHVAKTLGNASDSPPSEFVRLINSNLAFKLTRSGEYAHYEDCMNLPPFGATMLTITKSLQDQYAGLFEDIKFMKGKSNYLCTLDDEFTVDMAPCLLTKSLSEKCIAERVCPYYNARAKALTAKSNALNYKMFFSLPEHVKQRQYLICDEAAELEDELVKHFTCEINFQILKKLGINVNPLPLSEYSKYQRWAESLLGDLYDRIEDLKGKVKSLDKAKTTKIKKWIRVLQSIRGSVMTLVETFYDSDYQVEKKEHGVTFIPLKVDKLSGYLFAHGTKIVLMSATIIDHKNFCKTLGIDKYKYIEVDSPFEAKNAPIYCSTSYKLNYKNIDNVLDRVIDMVEQICKEHDGQKGIIHTHSNKITKAVQSRFVLNSRFLYREEGVSNEQILNLHSQGSTDTVLVSPSMSHGVDLKGDLAEFQIIMKAPYLPLGDIRVKKLFDMDKQWYANKMMCTVIQSCGRGIRSGTDKCVTYILDGAVTDAIKRNRDKIPGYFLDRFQ